MPKTQPSNLVKFFVSNSYRSSSVKNIGDRTKTIGGSEIFAACCSTPVSTRNVIKNKVGLGSSTFGGASIIHGNIYEATTMKIAMLELNCIIVEPNGGYKINQYEHNSYSADGVGTVMVNRRVFDWFLAKSCVNEKDIYAKANLGGKKSNEYKNYIPAIPHNMGGNIPMNLLFELKSTYTRVLDDTVKKEYCHQILTGLDIIREAAGGIFVQCDIKPCDKYDFSDDYHNKFGETLLSSYEKEPTLLGKKYFIGLTENYRREDSVKLETFRVNDQGMAHYANYGVDYTSIDAPVFYMRDDVLIMDEFEFLKSLKDIKDHYNTTKDLRIQIEEAEGPLLVMIEEAASAIMAAESDDLTKIGEFYDKLDVFFYDNLSAFAQNPWKLLKSEYHLFPSLKGFCSMYSDKCTDIIKAVKSCEHLNAEEKLAYVNGYTY